MIEYVHVLCEYDKDRDVIVGIFDVFKNEEDAKAAMVQEEVDEGNTFLLFTTPLVAETEEREGYLQ